MATLADELQNDFADSGSDRGEDVENDVDDTASGLNVRSAYGIMEEDEDDEDENMGEEPGDSEPKVVLLDEAEEEEEARLNSDSVMGRESKDMRGVANFMRSMEPILEVSSAHPINLARHREFTPWNS